ncbi:MAG: Flp family type IVb pilin [Candidatus Binataceae bacterium]
MKRITGDPMRGFSLTEDIRRFLAAHAGATSIEYALIAAGVSITIITIVTTLGSQLQSTFYDKLSSMF